MAGPTTVRIDLRTVLPVAALALVVLVIIFVQLCGREHVQPLSAVTPLAQATLGPTFTPGPSPTERPAQATATQAAQAGGAERDQVRLRDLAAIQTALAQYRQKHSAYPSTTGGIQSLCVYPQDIGCKLKDVVNSLPVDPLGDPSTNGYWYESQATSYTLYAQREGSVVPECSTHPAHLAKFRSILCVHGP